MIKNNKKGISLIILVITLIVSLILVSITIAATGNAIENANITEFVDNLNLVKDTVEAYYIANGEIPNKAIYNQQEIVELVQNYYNENNEYSQVFISDLKQNGDYNSTDEENNDIIKFYVIDLSSLSVERTEIGNGVRNNLDYFAIAYPSMNIYYLQGMELKGDIYFSLNDRLASISNITDNNDKEISKKIEVKTFEGITIKKNNQNWTNDLHLTITSKDINSVYLQLAQSSYKYNLNSELIDIHSIDELASILGISDTEISQFNNLTPENRYIEIIKQNDENIVAKLKLSLSNYDNIAPSIKNVSVQTNSEMSILNYSLEDTQSQINEIRYEYLTKFDENGTVLDYYSDKSTVDIDNNNYMLTKSKKVKAMGKNNVSIKVPKNVNKIIVYVIDNAGNCTVEHDRVVKDSYSAVTANINYYTSNSFNFSLDVLGNYSKIETSLSNVKNSEVKTFVNSEKIPNTIDYTNLPDGTNEVDLKIKITDKNGGENIENVKVDLQGNYPYIPQGFYYVAGTIDDGFIISDNKNDSYKSATHEVAKNLVGNQFVWIPVDIEASSVQNLKAIWKRVEFETGTDKTVLTNKMTISDIYTEPISYKKVNASSKEIEIYDKVLESIYKYKGFYVGRYETGDVSAKAPRTEESGVPNTLGIKSGLYVYNFIQFGSNVTDINVGASYLANNMYNNKYIGSNLIFGIQWDSIMKYIDKNGSNSINWGNYKDFNNKSNSVQNYKTGMNVNWSAKHIYDLAGNMSEWTMEGYSDSGRVARGGNYSQSGAINAAASRTAYAPSIRSELIGFRVCLYMKN